MKKISVLIACAAMAWLASAAQAHQPTTERQTRFGPVVGVDDSAASGTYAWKGVPFAKPPVGELRWKAPVDPDEWKAPRPTQQFGNACVQYGRIYGPGANNRYDPTIGTTLNQAVGSEDCLYLNIWRPGRTARGDRAGDRLRARRQQRLRLHRRPGLRRRGARQGGRRGRRVGQLPARHLRLPQRAAAQVGHRRAGGLGQLRAARHHQGAAVRPARHRQVRRQPEQRHADGPVGRRDQRLCAADHAGHRRRAAAAVPPRGAAERRHLAGEQPAAGPPADAEPGVGLPGAGQPAAPRSS